MPFAQLAKQLDHLYYGCCTSKVELAAAPKDYEDHIQALIQQIFDLQKAPVFDEVLFKTYGNKLTQAMLNGYGINLKQVDWSTASSKTVTELLNNVWSFSAAKTYTQLKDFGALLVKPDGSYRNFKDFKIEAERIAKTQLTWLKAEYNNAVGGAQMVALWKKIQAEKDILPLLQFDAVLDKGTTALCESINGVIKPVDDPFWLIYFPLNHWGCRSTVRQLRRGEITPDEDISYPELPAMFKTNLGEKGLIFPLDHPYFTETPPEVYAAARAYTPYPAQFDVIEESNVLEGLVRQHYLTDTNSKDYQRLLKIALDKAKKQGTVVDILPTLNPNKYADQRVIIFPDAKIGKSADLRINGKLVEEEASTISANFNNIKHAITAGSKQADHVLISLSEPIKIETMKRLAIGRFKDHKLLQTIEFVFNGVYTLFKRP